MHPNVYRWWVVSVAGLLITLAVVNVALVFRLGAKPAAPSPVSAASPSPPARLRLTIITEPTCAECSSLEPLADALSRQPATVERTTMPRSDPTAAELISRHAITRLPSAVVTGELDVNPTVRQFLSRLGSRSGDAVVYRDARPPYLDVGSGKVKGKVTLTLLDDSACADCYKVREHERILANFGIRDPAAAVVDVRSAVGRKLQQRYRITNVPTFLLAGEVSEYAGLLRIWPQVGTVEPDGTYVFSAGVKDMGVYRDLASGKIVRPAPTPTPSPRPSATPAPSPTPSR